jgi:hypothetical protein
MQRGFVIQMFEYRSIQVVVVKRLDTGFRCVESYYIDTKTNSALTIIARAVLHVTQSMKSCVPL